MIRIEQRVLRGARRKETLAIIAYGFALALVAAFTIWAVLTIETKII